MNTVNYQSPSALLFLRHKISVTDSNLMIDKWLNNHPQKSREDLSKLLQSRKVIFKNDRLVDLPQLTLEEAKLLVQKIHQNSVLEVKDRWYKLKCYPQCFVGSELVDCLGKIKGIATEEAIALGQNLLEHKLIQHVCNDHEFKNEFLFYRFL